LTPLAVFLDELLIWESCLRVLIQILHVRMRRRRIEVEVILLHIFAVVALISCQPEKTLFENWIAPIPQRQRKADPLVAVADPADPVFSPAIRARTGMFVWKIFP